MLARTIRVTSRPALAAPVATQPPTEAEVIASAESAAPAAVSKDAAVVTIDAEGHMTVVREGSNGFTCMPDVPETPGADPMCGDAGAMKWTDAWLAHQDPPAGLVGFGYMLADAILFDKEGTVAGVLPGTLQMITKHKTKWLIQLVPGQSEVRVTGTAKPTIHTISAV